MMIISALIMWSVTIVYHWLSTDSQCSGSSLPAGWQSSWEAPGGLHGPNEEPIPRPAGRRSSHSEGRERWGAEELCLVAPQHNPPVGPASAGAVSTNNSTHWKSLIRLMKTMEFYKLNIFWVYLLLQVALGRLWRKRFFFFGLGWNCW